MRRRLLLLLGLALPPAASQRRVFIAQGGVTDLRKGPLALGVTTASLLGDPAIYRANFLIENGRPAVQFEQLYETLTQPERGGLVGTGNGTAAAPEGAFSRLYDAVGQTMSFDVYFDRSIEETIYVGVVRAFQVPNPLDPFGGSYTNFYGQYAVRVRPVANDNQYNLEMSLLEDGEAWTAEWGPIKFNSFTDWITIERTFRDRVNLYLTTLLPGRRRRSASQSSHPAGARAPASALSAAGRLGPALGGDEILPHPVAELDGRWVCAHRHHRVRASRGVRFVFLAQHEPSLPWLLRAGVRRGRGADDAGKPPR